MTSIIDWAKLREAIWFNNNKTELSNPAYWEKEAASYNELCADMTDLTQKQLNRLLYLSGCTVLEVGAGTGRLTIPIAKRAKQVTALEPSENMLVQLKEAAQKEKLKNIVCINETLENLDTSKVAPHDLVIASFSLVMTDLEKALRKIDALAVEGVYLFLSASRWMDEEMHRAIYGVDAPLGYLSDFICIYNILHDAGILANVDLWDFQVMHSYDSLDKAADSFEEKYNIPHAKRPLLSQYLSKTLVADEKGKLWWKCKRKAAMVWWIKKR
jgi:SAM-dependent methyltransferase